MDDLLYLLIGIALFAVSALFLHRPSAAPAAPSDSSPPETHHARREPAGEVRS